MNTAALGNQDCSILDVSGLPGASVSGGKATISLALAVTPRPQADRRSARRFLLRLPVRLQLPAGGEVLAETRDVSYSGVCFHASSFPAHVGSRIEFIMTLPSAITLNAPMRVHCGGRAVRVEKTPASEGVAIAVAIDRYEFLASQL